MKSKQTNKNPQKIPYAKSLSNLNKTKQNKKLPPFYTKYIKQPKTSGSDVY